MLSSISPLGERARGNRWATTVAWLSLGAVVGGASVGAVFAALGRALTDPGRVGIGVDDRAALVVLAAACLLAALWDLSGRRLPGRRQVNEGWLVGYRSWVYGAGFGLQLGAAVVTVVNTALVPVFMLAAALTGDVAAGLAIGAVFGAARAASMLVVRKVRTTGDLQRLHRRIEEFAGSARRAGAATAATLAGAAAAALIVL